MGSHGTWQLKLLAITAAIAIAALSWFHLPAQPASAVDYTAGSGSCVGVQACEGAVGTIGDNSCIGDYSCNNAGQGTLGGVTIGNGSCVGYAVCQYLGAYATGSQTVGDNSCTGTTAYYPSGQACNLAGAVGSGLTIGNNSCNGDGECTSAGQGTGPTAIGDCSNNTVTPNACLVATTVEVRKFLFPSYDSGKFDLSVAGNVEATAVGHNGTTGPVEVTPGSVTVAEAGANGTNTHNYRTTVVCVADGGFVGHGYSTSLDIYVYPEQAVVCTFINQRLLSFRWWWWR